MEVSHHLLSPLKLSISSPFYEYEPCCIQGKNEKLCPNFSAEKTSDNVIGKVGVQDQADKPKGMTFRQ